MTRVDRIAAPWGTRTPYGPGERWPVRTDTYLADGLAPEDVDRWVQSATILHSNGDGLDIAVKDGSIVGVRGRAQDRVNHGRLGPQGPVRLAGQRLAGPADPAARAPPRRAGRDGLGHRDGPRRAAQPGAAGGARTQRDRLLHHGSAVPRGVLHARGDGARRHRHQPRRRQHPPVHRDRRRRAQGVVRLRRAARLVHRHRPRRRDRPVRAQHGRDPDGAVDARSSTGWPGRTRRRIVCVDPRPHRGGTARGRPPGPPARDERRAHERPAAARSWPTAGSTRSTCRPRRRVRRAREQRRRRGRPRCAARSATSPSRRCARLPGSSATAERLVSTVLQGFYQSHQATAAAVQVNNLHILRGMLGAPGRGILQMNGQPTAQNTREAGADGDLAGFRNWSNDAHVADLARVWNIDPMQIPHYSPPDPRHAAAALRRGRLAALLWVQATNPLVSLPELQRVRSILTQQRLFLVVQDIFLTETAQLADVVLPAATWGEKDRHVHQRRPHRALLRTRRSSRPAKPDRTSTSSWTTPAGWASATRTARPFVHWHDPRSAFEAWKECAPRPALRLQRAQLREAPAAGRASSGRATRRTPRAPSGSTSTVRSGAARTTARATAATWSPAHRSSETEYRALNPDGKAVLKAARVHPAARAAERGVPAAADHGPDAVPLPHPHQDRPGRRSCRPPHPRSGSRCPRPTPAPTVSTRATCWK